MGRIPGVERLRRIQAGELGGDRLAHHDGASLLEAGKDSGILVGHEVSVDSRAGGGGDAGSVEDVFDTDGYAMQGARIRKGIQLALALFGIGQHSLAVDVHPGLQRFQGVGALQQGFGDVNGAYLAGTNRPGKLGGGEFVKFGHEISSNSLFGNVRLDLRQLLLHALDRRAAGVPVGGLLIGVGGAEESCLVEGTAYELQADGQVAGGEAAIDGHGGHAGHIEG